MLAQAVKSLVSRTLTGSWYPVDDGDTVFVITRFEVTLISNKDITVVQRELVLRHGSPG